MALNFDSLVIDRVVDITAENSDGELLYMLNNFSNVSINTTSESKDKTDAQGVLIKRFFTAKQVEVSGECNLLSLSMIAEQTGTEKIVASTGKKIKAPKILKIDTTGITSYTIPAGMRPTVLNKLYAVNTNGTLGKSYSLGTTASDTQFTYDETTGVITLPLNVTGVLVAKYEYETASGVKVIQTSDKFPRTVHLTIKVLVADTCSVDVVRAAYIVIPSFQTSPDFDLTLDTDSAIAFSGVAQRDYCSVDSELYYIVLTEDDVE